MHHPDPSAKLGQPFASRLVLRAPDSGHMTFGQILMMLLGICIAPAVKDGMVLIVNGIALLLIIRLQGITPQGTDMGG